MKVVYADEVEGRLLGDAASGTLRTVKVLVTSKNMKVHMGFIPPKTWTSEHSHPGSEEVVFVVKGHGEILSEGDRREYHPNTLVFVPPGNRHQYHNLGGEETVLVAVYSPPTELASK